MKIRRRNLKPQLDVGIQGSESDPGPAAHSNPAAPEREQLARTIDVWDLRSSRPLTDEDARQISENLVGFFRVLIEWKAKQAASTIKRDRNAA
jgi:hypothetical protein